MPTVTYPDGQHMRSREFLAPYLVLSCQQYPHACASIRLSIAEVDKVRLGRGPAFGYERTSDEGLGVLDIHVDDPWLSESHAQLQQRDGGWVLTDLRSKNGTICNGESIGQTQLQDGDLIQVGGCSLLFRSRIKRSFREAADCSLDPGQATGMQTLSLPFARALQSLSRVATSGSPITLLGATGTGKEVVAREIHRLSRRPSAFVAINCGALPAELVESELFGAVAGAYSGAAVDRDGLVRAADGGTLFLDEVGELPLSAQVKLLRVLQESEVTPVGGTRPRKVDLRVLCATNRDLGEMTQEGRFREDLYARLAGYVATLPSLCERREDIGWLLDRFIGKYAPQREPVISRDAARLLFTYDWPQNIRELEQVIRAAISLANDNVIDVEHLPGRISQGSRTATVPPEALADRVRTLLGEHQGNVSAVARVMGKERVQIRRWCKRFEIDVDKYR